ncbi:acyl-CoA N-acyltransferase [Ampelomyces quisqualis]|uniref:Acyl-CoA N-acyltransferase n=1 Tax=Ampelomyces quisqualis TaxID=50730 RepID=A0A6A5QF31_AMPQU|nr:acyl-CoA N-acyltransferase [Ampelomyces quisqualis]
MSSHSKATLVQIPEPSGQQQTLPTESSARIPDEELRIEFCTPADAERIAEGNYLTFPSTFFDRVEPLSLRPPHAIRIARLAKRILPSLSDPRIKWIKAIHTPSSAVLGIACWTAPNAPLHLHLRRDAIAPHAFDWQAKMGWSDDQVDDMWSSVSHVEWNVRSEQNDAVRRSVVGDVPHWHLASLFTWPRWQGRGVGKKLLMWAIEQADENVPSTPMFLESAPTARAVYMHFGFVECGKVAMVRWGPGDVSDKVERERRKRLEEEGR